LPDLPAALALHASAAAVAAAGVVLSACCGRVALAYRRRIDAGEAADARSMALSLGEALSPAGRMGGGVEADRARMAAKGRPGALPFSPAYGFSMSAALCMATGFFLLFVRHGPGAYFLAAALAGVLLLLAARIDAQTGLLPDALTQPLLWLGLGVAWAGEGPALHDALAGVMLGYGFLWCLLGAFKWLSGRDAMGHGDLKLLAALGAWMGWQPLPWALLLACMAGMAFAMWRQRSLRPRGAYPFGPFLAVGGAGVFLHATAVHSWFC